MIKAELQKLEADNWCLVGQVEFTTAEALAADIVKALPVNTELKHLPIDLHQASGGSALLLVLLAWQRDCLALGVELTLLNPPLQLQKVAELSHLHNLLPLMIKTKELG